jgi:hypothetical protein
MQRTVQISMYYLWIINYCLWTLLIPNDHPEPRGEISPIWASFSDFCVNSRLEIQWIAKR